MRPLRGGEKIENPEFGNPCATFYVVERPLSLCWLIVAISMGDIYDTKYEIVDGGGRGKGRRKCLHPYCLGNMLIP